MEKLGSGFDGRCVRFLGIRYEDLVVRLKEGGTDEEIFQWALERGRKPSQEDMENWNEFMLKCGWKDVVSPILDRRKKESGLQNRDDIETMFQYIDVDEAAYSHRVATSKTCQRNASPYRTRSPTLLGGGGGCCR